MQDIKLTLLPLTYYGTRSLSIIAPVERSSLMPSNVAELKVRASRKSTETVDAMLKALIELRESLRPGTTLTLPCVAALMPKPEPEVAEPASSNTGREEYIALRASSHTARVGDNGNQAGVVHHYVLQLGKALGLEG